MRLLSRSVKTLVVCSFLLSIGLLSHSAQAIIVYGDGRNTSAPTGAYADSGWQYAAFVGGYAANNDFVIGATVWPIAPNWVLRATHTTGGNGIGYPIYQDGVGHTIVESITIYDNQGNPTDLSLQRVDTPFARYAPMYTGNNELGQNLIVYGSGTADKGDPLYANGSSTQAGWSMVNGDGTTISHAQAFAWGLNQVADTRTIQVGGSTTDTLYATFDKPTLDDGSANPASMGANEAMAGFGDSSGGVFINNGGQWQLAGVIWAIDAGIYYDQTSGNPYSGFLYDYRGFYVDNGQGGRDLVTGSDPVGVGFYASRVSQYQSQISGVVGVIVPESGTGILSTLGITALGLVTMQLRRRKAK